jgi:hypothetical protein
MLKKSMQVFTNTMGGRGGVGPQAVDVITTSNSGCIASRVSRFNRSVLPWLYQAMVVSTGDLGFASFISDARSLDIAITAKTTSLSDRGTIVWRPGQLGPAPSRSRAILPIIFRDFRFIFHKKLERNITKKEYNQLFESTHEWPKM